MYGGNRLMVGSLALLKLAIYTASEPKKLIVDTDMLNFIDDPEAIALANVFESWGHVRVLAVMSSVFSRFAPPAIDAINEFYGHGHIPVAIQKPVNNSTIDERYPQYFEYLTGLASDFPHNVKDGTDTEEPVTLYRRLLASSPNSSVTIAQIGFYDNLFHLLESHPDAASALSGRELVTSKVAELVVSADLSKPNGDSFNLREHNFTYAETVLNGWPGLLTIVPDQLGDHVQLGARLTTETNITANPVAYAFNTSIGFNKTHQAWDATLMYYAARGLDQVYTYASSHGHLTVSPEGKTTWDTHNNSTMQRSLALSIDNASFSRRLEDILLWQNNHDSVMNAQANNQASQQFTARIVVKTISRYTGTITDFLVPCGILAISAILLMHLL